MAQSSYPDAMALREQVDRHLTVILNGERRLGDSTRPLAADLLPIRDAIKGCAELLQEYQIQLLGRHFAACVAATTQPTMRKFSGEPMLGVPVARRVATTRAASTRARRTDGAGKQRAAGRSRRAAPVQV